MVASRIASLAATRAAALRSSSPSKAAAAAALKAASSSSSSPYSSLLLRSFSTTTPAKVQSETHGAAQAHASNTAHQESQSSDTPYAIASFVVFGALFVYLTSPASKAHNEHGHIVGAHKPTSHGHGSSVVDDKTGDDAVWKQDDDEEEQSAHAKEEKDHAAHLAGHQSLLNMPSKPADHQKSPSGRDPSNETSGYENSNFQHGIAAAKDGDHVSDPKKVVAAANAAKQEKKAEKEKAKEDITSAADSANSPEGGKEEDADPEGKKEEDKE